LGDPACATLTISENFLHCIPSLLKIRPAFTQRLFVPMIASLRGTLLEKDKETIVLDIGGMGYEVLVAPSTLEKLPPLGENVMLYVVESVGMYGGGVTYYGFLTSGEKQIFNVIRGNVPGIGAKKALDLLEKAGKSLPDFRKAVLEKDTRLLVTMFGFSKRTAEKIVAGLQNVLEEVPALAGLPSGGGSTSSFEDTIQGLVALGYRESAARCSLAISGRLARQGGHQVAHTSTTTTRPR